MKSTPISAQPQRCQSPPLCKTKSKLLVYMVLVAPVTDWKQLCLQHFITSSSGRNVFTHYSYARTTRGPSTLKAEPGLRKVIAKWQKTCQTIDIRQHKTTRTEVALCRSSTETKAISTHALIVNLTPNPFHDLIEN